MNHNHTISPEELEQIERFITGNMPEDESLAFTQQIKTNNELQQKTDEIKLLLTGINENLLEEKIQEFHSEMLAPAATVRTLPKVISIGKKLMMAASILAVAGLLVWWFAGKKSDNENLYSEFFTPDPGLATVMGNSANYEFEKAMVEYKNGEYEKALTAWNLLLKNNSSSDTLIYFTGVAYQALNNENAIPNLLKVANDTTSAFQKDASWYLGLWYLKQNQKEKALQYIGQSGHPKSADAIKAINQK